MSWSTIVGHGAQIATLARAVERNRLAHAYLFVGPSGIGKRRVARQLAKTLLCENATIENWNSCDECSACRLVDAGSHPDLFEVQRPEDKLEFPVAVIQELCQSLALKPARGGRKIAIIDDADDFNDESANAFLKTLEEPPPSSLLILIATIADRQLPTIRSRCQTLAFSALAPRDVETILRDADDVDPEAIARLAAQCGGRPGFAREFADPRIWEIRTRLLAIADADHADALALAAELWGIVQEAGKDAAVQRRRATVIIRLLIDALSGALARLADAEPTALQAVPRDRLVELLELCLDADMRIERRVQLQLAVEAFVYGWSRPGVPAHR